jgi:hypothetical protein
MKIKEYSIITSNKFIEFIDKCNSMINDGFQPYKGISTNIFDKSCITNVNEFICYTQAFIKYEEEFKPEIKYILDIDDYNKFKKEWQDCKEPSTIIFNKKQEPFLDWQENRPDNKPKSGEFVLVIKKNNYPKHTTDVYQSSNSERCYGDWEFSNDHHVVKWSYIPE